jgi:hypothetical protein
MGVGVAPLAGGLCSVEVATSAGAAEEGSAVSTSSTCRMAFERAHSAKGVGRLSKSFRGLSAKLSKNWTRRYGDAVCPARSGQKPCSNNC